MEIRLDDASGPEIVRLVEGHLANMHAITPPGSVHAIGIEALRAPGVTLWTAWDGAELLGCGALRELDATRGEIKSMRTSEARRRSGVGARILETILEEAARRGYRELLLETGASAEFVAARTLYARYGFEPRGPFGDYADDPNSVFMARRL